MVKKKKKKSQVPFRLNIIFFTVFILFSILVVQLGVVQILEGASYQTEIDQTIEDISKVPVPRGEVYDSNYNLVVNNKPTYSITYTPPKRVQAHNKLELAEKLVQYMKVDKKTIKKVTENNKKEYWYLKNKKTAISRLTEKEIKDLDDAEQYHRALELITDDEISEFTDDEMKVIAIKRELDKAYSLTPQIIKNKNISMEEYLTIAEHLHNLPGINVATDWNREYIYGDTLKSIIGNITTQEQGIPAEKQAFYLAKGYNRNDRVGISGLEQYYEDVLRGRKEKIRYTTTKSGQMLDSKVLVPGERGKDIVLSIDMEFQEKVDEIVKKEFKKTKEKFSHQNRYFKDALAVVSNPKTGEILALSAIHYNEDGEYEKAPYKTLFDAYAPGSTVKGATILAGLESGVISPGQHFVDRPITIKGTNPKGSYTTNIGSVNDITALQKSSNVYMFYIALKMGGENRYPFPDGKSATFNRVGLQNMRNYFQQLGLGAHTGIDFPYETTGVLGSQNQVGHVLMDLSIGQFDTYSAMQLGQYIATIANDGYRTKPTLVREIRSSAEDGGMGAIYKSNDTHILNKVNVQESYMKRVQDGFWQAFNSPGGTGYAYWAGKPYKAAGKTGTAENDIYENGKKAQSAENLALVGYAPFDDPEVSFAIIAPNLGAVRGQHPITHSIGTQVLDTYFEMKEASNNKEENKE